MIDRVDYFNGEKMVTKTIGGEIEAITIENGYIVLKRKSKRDSQIKAPFFEVKYKRIELTNDDVMSDKFSF